MLFICYSVSGGSSGIRHSLVAMSDKGKFRSDQSNATVKGGTEDAKFHLHEAVWPDSLENRSSILTSSPASNGTVKGCVKDTNSTLHESVNHVDKQMMQGSVLRKDGPENRMRILTSRHVSAYSRVPGLHVESFDWGFVLVVSIVMIVSFCLLCFCFNPY